MRTSARPYGVLFSKMTRLWTVDIPRTTSRLIVAKQKMADDCRDFFNANGADLAVVGAEAAGIDFWLTRNRHGAGFWDRGLGNLGTRLTDAAQAFGECDLYVGDDGKLYLQPS